MNTTPDDIWGPTDEAAEWLMIHDRGLTDEESRRFAVWIGSSDANKAAWNDAESMWQSFDEEPDALLASMRASALAARPKVASRTPIWGAAAAAALVLTLGTATWMALPRAGEISGANAVASSKVYSAGGTRTEIALADGSRVLLDAGTRITVNEAGVQRNISLDVGQAFFKVAHDPSRPFVVAASGRTVTATGTAFAVSKDRTKISVVLQEGKVRIEVPGNPSARVNLLPGQQYDAAGQGRAVVRLVQVDEALAWRDGYLSFHNVTVREALAKMDLAVPPRVLLGDVAVGDLRVSGRFRTGDPAAFVETLGAMYSVRIVHLPSGQLRISSRAGGQRRGPSGR